MELCRIRVSIDDTPGQLAEVAGALAAIGANICEVDLHAVDGRSRADELLVDLGRPMDLRAVEIALADVGCAVDHLEPADPHDLTDPVTRALELAHRAITAPDDEQLVQAAITLFRAERGRIIDHDEATRSGGIVGRAATSGLSQSGRVDGRWCAAVPVAHRGRPSVVELRRTMPAFTPTEIARVRALLRAGAAARHARPATSIDLARIRVRALRKSDEPALVQFLGQCRAQLLQTHPLYAAVDDIAARLDRLIEDHADECAVGAELDGRLVGLAHAMIHLDQRTATVSFLVADTQQRRGVASVLRDAIGQVLPDRGVERIEALALPGDTALVSLLRGLGSPLRMHRDTDAIRISVALPRSTHPDRVLSGP